MTHDQLQNIHGCPHPKPPPPRPRPVGILHDMEIKRLCVDHNMIEPHDPAQVNSASYDVRIGRTIVTDIKTGAVDEMKSGDVVRLDPGDFVLIGSLERFNFPPDICGHFYLKSSTGRQGLNHALAGWCDPGWAGVLTMEVQNILKWQPLFLRPGDLIGQMIFERMPVAPLRGYGEIGRYQNDDGVRGAKPGSPDFFRGPIAGERARRV